MNPQEKKLSIIAFSGDFDRLLAAFTLASGAAAVGWKVNMFFTFWGLNVMKKDPGRVPLGKGLLDRLFNFLMGGRSHLPLSRLNFFGLSPRLMTGLMKKRNVATLPELLQAARDLKVSFYACETAMVFLGLERKDLAEDVVEVLGVAKFLDYSTGGEVLFL
jgi:peroxiredoxin family protein